MTRYHSPLLPTLLLILCSLSVGCSRYRCREAEKSFAIAESLMDFAPDSALSVAEAVDSAGLCPDCFFRRDVIIAKAKTKAYISLAPDTARLKAAAAHFAGRGDSLEVQSLYYYGFSLYSADRYSEALIALHDAYDIASATGDHFYAAMSARSLSFMYGDLLIMDRALKWALLARKEFAAAGKPLHEEWMKELIARWYIWNGEFDSAHTLLDSTDISLPNLHQVVIELRAKNYDQQKLYPEAIEQWHKLKKLRGGLKSREWSILGEELHHIGDYTAALSARDSAIISRNDEMDSIFVDYLSAMIYNATGRYREGLESGLRFAKAMIRHNDEVQLHPKTLLLTDYLKLKAEHHREETRHARRMTMFITVITLLVIILLISVISNQRRRIRERRGAETDLLLQLKALKDEINLNREESEKNLDRLSSTAACSEALKAELGRLFGQRFGLLDELCAIWYENPEGAKTDRQFRRRVVSLLGQFRSEENLNEISRLIDSTYDGWMTRFRSLYPDLSTRSYTLVLYLFIGLSTQTITMLMDKSRLNTVYVMRNRLKNKLISANPEAAEEIIARLRL